MRKKDFIGGIGIGLLCAFLFFINFYTLGLQEKVIERYGQGVANTVANLLSIFPVLLPTLSVVGLWVINKIRERFLVLYQAGKNILVGILNTLVDLTVLNYLIFLTNITEGALFSFFKAISFSVATLNSYFWNKYWTFEKTETGVKAKEVSEFYVVAVGGLVINVAIASFLVNVVGPQFGIPKQLWANLAVILATVGNFIWNFTGYKFLIFKK